MELLPAFQKKLFMNDTKVLDSAKQHRCVFVCTTADGEIVILAHNTQQVFKAGTCHPEQHPFNI